MTPLNPECHATLACAYVRAGRTDEAIDRLQKVESLRESRSGVDWLFLALAQLQQGNTELASSSLKQARDWRETNLPDRDELNRLEQEVVLAIEEASKL